MNQKIIRQQGNTKNSFLIRYDKAFWIINYDKHLKHLIMEKGTVQYSYKNVDVLINKLKQSMVLYNF